MRKLKLSLLNKWELDKDYSIVLSSAMLHDGRAVVLTSEKETFNRYCLLEVSSLGVKEIAAWDLAGRASTLYRWTKYWHHQGWQGNSLLYW